MTAKTAIVDANEAIFDAIFDAIFNAELDTIFKVDKGLKPLAPTVSSQ